MTLSLINFLFCWSRYQNSLSILLSQKTAITMLKKLCRRNTHVSSLLALVKMVAASAQKITKEIFVKIRFVDTIENTHSDLKVHALHYANDLLLRVRLPFQKLLLTRQ